MGTMKLGARIFKTGLAIVLSLILADLFQLSSPVFAAISASFAVQPSIYRSYLSLLEQVQGNVIGALIAVVFVFLFDNHFLTIGLAAIVLIMIHNKLNIEKTISLSLVTLIIIMDSPNDDFIHFALFRFLAIMLGILAAFLINMIFFPPKYEKKLYNCIAELTNDLLLWIRFTNKHVANLELLKKEMKTMEEKFEELEQMYSFFKEERSISIKTTPEKKRKLVIYRNMITVLKTSKGILQKLHHFEKPLSSMPNHLYQSFHGELELLTGRHEFLIFSYAGRAKQIHPNKNHKDRLFYILKEFYSDSNDESKKSAELFQLIALIMEYNDQVDHLEVLLNSWQKYHHPKQPEHINM